MLNVRKNYFCSFQELSNVNLSDLSSYFCIKYIINLQNIVKFVQCPLKNVKRTHTHTHTHTHHWIKSPSVIVILTKINAEFLDRHHYFNFYIKIQLMSLPLSNYGWLNQGLISYIKKKKKKNSHYFLLLCVHTICEYCFEMLGKAFSRGLKTGLKTNLVCLTSDTS